jgi:hypothetical protein
MSIETLALAALSSPLAALVRDPRFVRQRVGIQPSER